MSDGPAADAAPAAVDEEDAGGVDAPAAVELRHGVPVSTAGPGGQVVLHPSREQYLDVVRALRAEGFWQCIDVCAVDYLIHPGRSALPPGVAPERFEVVTQLICHRPPARIRLRVQVPADDPTCPSLVGIHPGAETPEREAYDLFGVSFDGHPDMTRILMPDEWTGHPLRKDEAIGAIPVQFKGSTNVR